MSISDPAAQTLGVVEQLDRRLGFLSPQASGWRIAMLAFPLAALIVGVLLWLSAGVLTFQDDAAQFVSTAAHLLAGDGARTSILYYDNQLAQSAPAVQTVWPVGFPAIAALLAQMTGLAVARAILLVAIGAHIGTALLLGVTLRMAGMTIWMVLAVAGFWLMFVPSWLSVSRGLSDPLYQMFAIAIAVAVAGYYQPWHERAELARGRQGLPWLALAALGAMGALMVRYQAVALIAPLALAMTVGRFQAQPMRWRLAAGLAVIAPPILLLALLFGRNLSLTGTLTGGAVASQGQSIAGIASRISWAPQWAQLSVLFLLMLSCLVCAVAALMLWVRDTRQLRAEPAHCPPATRAALIYCLAAYAGNIGLLLLLCLTSTVYVIELRYLGVCVLFLVLPLAWLASNVSISQLSSGHGSRPADRLWAEYGLACLIAVLTFGQLFILQRPYLDRLSQAPPLRLSQILSAYPIAGKPALAMLRGTGTRRPVLMSTHAHALSLLTDTTVIGVPASVYTDQRRDEPQIQWLARRHRVDYVVAFRGLDTWVYRDLVNKMLDRNHCPDWLSPILANPDLVIARVTDPTSAKTCKLPIPPPRGLTGKIPAGTRALTRSKAPAS